MSPTRSKSTTTTDATNTPTTTAASTTRASGRQPGRVAHGDTPLFILDVWEHAYYIDYRNARPNFADTILKKHVNWAFVAQNLDGNGAERANQPG